MFVLIFINPFIKKSTRFFIKAIIHGTLQLETVVISDLE